MAKVSPIVRSMNAGEFSPLVEGRTDLDRYPSSCRQMFNTIAAPQGPSLSRGGSEFVGEVYDSDYMSTLIPFVFSETDFYQIEFSNMRVRFFTETGLLTYTPVAISITQQSPLKFDSATLGANVGDEVAFSGFDPEYNMNGIVGKITAKVGTIYTVDTVPVVMLPLLGSQLGARVYHIDSPYSSAQIVNVHDTPSLDVVYLTNKSIKTYKLQRSDTYSWAFVEAPFSDGPYLTENETKTTLTPSATGRATPTMTSATLPSGTASASSEVVGNEAWKAFDDPTANTWWEGNANQAAWLQYQSAAGFVCDGYSIQVPVNNTDASYKSVDYAPSNFEFLGSNDGVTFTLLDKQINYVLYDNNKSVFFEIPNTTSYTYYRLNVLGLTRNGALHPRVKSLVLRSTTVADMTLTANSITGINANAGFKATDVNRLVRVKANDSTWRPMKITAWTSTTVVSAKLLGEPFPDLSPTSAWRLGAYSDTTGYANTATFHDDRLWLGGSELNPDYFAASVTGDYDNHAPSTLAGEVLATNGISGKLNARTLSLIKWMESNKDGVATGTGSKEYLLRSADGVGKAILPTTGIRVAPSGSRGSSNMRPVAIDDKVLYGARGARTLREWGYAYDSDSYKSPSMSALASHLGISPFIRQAFAQEPYSIDWILRQDGLVVGLTYNRDENVVGWHRHDFGGVVESISVLPSSDQLRDVLWLCVRRTINGQTRRYIEKLTKFWDFDMTLEDAWFVDCGLRYTGEPTQTVYGLLHLEGRDDIYGLADGRAIGPLTVTLGAVELASPASNIVLGIGFESIGETSRLENGAQDGTAQGKVARIHNISLILWQSYAGQVGVWNEQTQEVDWADIQYETPDATEVDSIALKSGVVGPILPDGSYEKNKSIHFRRRKDQPYPLNIVALMPQLSTQDRG